MTFFVFVVSVLVGVGSLAYVYAGAGFNQFSSWLLVFGGLWLFAGWRRWSWFSSLGILVLLVLSAFGLWIRFPAGWMLSGAIGGLLAWDLSDFMRRLRSAPRGEDLRSLERCHLTRLTIVTLAGLFLAGVAMLVRLEFSFEWVALLVLVAALGVTQLVAWLRRGGE